MARKYNHRQKIKNRQPAKIKSVMPGMILEFNYKGKNIFDSRPLILVLYNEYFSQRRRGKNVLIHSVNLNYLNNASLSKFINQLNTLGPTKEKIEIVTKDPKDEQEARSNRGLLRETYTQISLPNFKRDFGKHGKLSHTHSLTRSEAKVQMNVVYEKLIKRYLLKKVDVYRTYKIKNMSNIKVLLFEI
jgi:hypothetical protein